MSSEPTRLQLLDAARAVRLRAHAPYSHFLVGAALLAEDGRIITGCNVENASYGLTICAERSALVKGVSEGCNKYRCIAVVTDAPTSTPPCGACRQLLWELAGDVEVILGNLTAETASFRMSQLLPYPFDVRSLER